MNKFDRLYESLLVNSYDRCSLNELWSMLRSSNPDERQAADETLSDLVQHGFLKVERVS
jgi:hypothetical protein